VEIGEWNTDGKSSSLWTWSIILNVGTYFPRMEFCHKVEKPTKTLSS